MVTEQPWQAGLIDASRSAQVNLIIFSGGVLESPHGFDSQRSKVFELAGQENIDGLIIGSDFLGHYVGVEKIKDFCDQYRPLPVVKYEPLVEGYPTLLFDFYQGMYDLINHLVEVHYFTKIGYITGPEQSRSIQDRYRAYRDALTAHGIPFDEQLVVKGSISTPSGHEAVHTFLDERGLKPGEDLQVVVGFYDSIAIDALNALQKRGIRVPDEVAVVGFDDEQVAYAANPRLTTVRLPFYEIGRWGVDTLVQLLQGQSPPPVTNLSASLVIRQSCGCKPVDALASELDMRAQFTGAMEPFMVLQQHREEILAQLIRTAGMQNVPRFQQEVESLLDLFIRVCKHCNAEELSVSFAEQLEATLSHMGSIPYNIDMISGILAVLQLQLSRVFPDEGSCSWIRSLFQQAHSTTSDFIQRHLIREKNQATYLDSLLHEINQEMTTALAVQDLVEVLWNHLPRLGIPACYLSLYENQSSAKAASPGFSRLILAYNQHGRATLPPNGQRFPSKNLFPGGTFHPEQPAALVVLPLFHREEQQGFVVFETGPRYGGLYEALREQISSALKRIQLHQKVVEARRVAEEANQLKSRFLSIVTHELRAPLSMIVSLSEMLLEDSQQNRPAIPDVYRQDLEVIHSTGQHLDRLVLDVLDLGRSQLGQLKINMKPLNLGELLREVQQMGEQMAKEKHLAWRARIPAQLPNVKGDNTRLRQILINLISNATKFTIQGEVSLLVTIGDREVTMAVSDTGIGIPLNDQKTIFDEFRQSDRTAARGYGGMGLGLAITRRLVELHGGKIQCISSGEEGSGTTFYFTLPIQPEGMPEIEPEAQPSEGAVLVISQEKAAAGTLTSYLENLGYPVQLVDIGPKLQKRQQVLQLALRHPCTAIVIHSDPETEWGQEVLRSLQMHPGKQDLPILFYTISPETNQGALLDLNVLPKPLSKNSIFQVFQQRGMTEVDAQQPARVVLVVDDEPEILRQHTQLVREHLPGCRVLAAQNGRQALGQMLQTRPDLVLLDLMMPEMDGFGVLEAMQTHQTLRAVPVIIMTSQVLTEEMILRLNRCVAGILGKGLFSVEETLKQIESSLARDKRLGSEPQRIARRTMALIHKKYAEPISRGDIASQIGVNERYLTHCFRQEVGITPMEYLNRYRVRIAQQLLETEQKSITEIGLEAGFTSSTHFSRVFHQHTGLSPREYLRTK